MEWKEPLSILLEGEKLSLDVRLICIKNKGKWFLKRVRATVFHSKPSIPEQICYPSYLFLRRKMNSLDFLQFMNDLTTRLPQEELEKLSEEEKLKKFSFNEWKIFCEVGNIYLNRHSPGNSRWGLADYAIPSWNFDGNLYPDLQESQEPLIAPEAYFPRPLDGEAWYLYEKALPSHISALPVIEISIEDDRAFFKSIDIDEEASILRCRCDGKLLSQSLVHLYTNSPQVEHKQASNEIVFQLQGKPTTFSLALTYTDTLLDRTDIDSAYPQFGVPKDVKIIPKSSRPGGGLNVDPIPVIEKIAQADPSDIKSISVSALELSAGYYSEPLIQSQQSFLLMRIAAVVFLLLFVAAIIILILQKPADFAYISMIGSAISACFSGIFFLMY